MARPTVEELTEKLGVYVEQTATSNPFVAECCAQAIVFIGSRFDPSVRSGGPTLAVEGGYVTAQSASGPEAFIIEKIFDRMPQETYEREVLELGSDLYYRRQARNGIVSVNAMEGTIARVSKDPYAASEARLVRFVGLGFA